MLVIHRQSKTPKSFSQGEGRSLQPWEIYNSQKRAIQCDVVKLGTLGRASDIFDISRITVRSLLPTISLIRRWRDSRALHRVKVYLLRIMYASLGCGTTRQMRTTRHIYTWAIEHVSVPHKRPTAPDIWKGSHHSLFPRTSQRHITLCVSSRRLIHEGQKPRSEKHERYRCQ